MPKHYSDYLKANKEAVDFFSAGEYASAISAYKRAVQALNDDITTIADKDKILHRMNEGCNVRENIVKCYNKLSLLRKELVLEEFLACGDSMLDYINAMKNFEAQVAFFRPKQLPEKLEADILEKKRFLESGIIVQWFSEFAKHNIQDTVSVKCQSREALQAYVTKFIPSLGFAKAKFDEIISELTTHHFITAELVTTATNVFIRKEAAVCEEIADKLMDFYNANKQFLAKQDKEALLKTAYECYKKYKDYMDLEAVKARYDDERLYRQDYCDIISSLATTVEQLVKINSDNHENVQMLWTVETYLENFKSKYYEKLSIEQQLTFLNGQCCIRYNMLEIKRQMQGYQFSNRLTLILANIFSFSRRIQTKEEQFKIEMLEIMGIYNNIVKEFLLDKLNASNCNPQFAATIIENIIAYSKANSRILGFQAEDLLALDRDGFCAKCLMQVNADMPSYTKMPHEALADFIQQLLLRKQPTALVAFSDIFTNVSISVVKKAGYGEIAKIFADFASYMPKPQSPRLPSALQTMVVPAAVPVSMSMSMEIVGDPPVLQESKKRSLVVEEPTSIIASATLPMFTHLVQRALGVREVAAHVASLVVAERKLPPKKRLCSMTKEQETIIMQQLSSAQSTTVGGIQRSSSIPCF